LLGGASVRPRDSLLEASPLVVGLEEELVSCAWVDAVGAAVVELLTG
jgi:hypothetical protein